MDQAPSNSIVARISTDLIQARKDGDIQKKEILQSILARITNAAAVPLGGAAEMQGIGVGSTEVRRRVLLRDEIRGVIQAEVDELSQAIESMSSHPNHPYMRDLEIKVTILSHYL